MKRMHEHLPARWVALVLGTIFLVLPSSVFAASQVSETVSSVTAGLVSCSYTVRRGDTLFGIAVRYNTNVYALAAMNGLYNPNFIYVGMALHVPCGGTTNPPDDNQPPSGICSYYLVRPGDYLNSIAAKFGIRWEAIARANHLYNPNWIYPGMRLAIPCRVMPPPGGYPWTFTSVKHQYVVNYPRDWTINVQTSTLGRDPEYVYLRPSATALPQVQILALKDEPPIKGFENCNKNLIFRGVGACSISLPRGQQPAQRLLIFQKGESYYHLAIQYEAQQQLAVFEEIVKSFQFTP